MIQASLGWTEEQIKVDPSRSITEFNRLTKGNLKLYDNATLTSGDVERIVKAYSPQLIVIDSIDEMVGFKADRLDQHYGEIYRWARTIAKKHCAVIGVCQASASAENKKWLTMEDIAEAKTAKAKHADFILGIGKTYDQGLEDFRYIHIVKDKCNAPQKKIECRIKPDVARYEEVNI